MSDSEFNRSLEGLSLICRRTLDVLKRWRKEKTRPLTRELWPVIYEFNFNLEEDLRIEAIDQAVINLRTPWKTDRFMELAQDIIYVVVSAMLLMGMTDNSNTP